MLGNKWDKERAVIYPYQFVSDLLLILQPCTPSVAVFHDIGGGK
jgi:hypothetical protein